MRVLLAGAARFVGRVALDLLGERHQVTAFDIRPLDGCAHAIQGDVLDGNAVAAAMRQRRRITVFRLSGSTGLESPGNGWKARLRPC